VKLYTRSYKRILSWRACSDTLILLFRQISMVESLQPDERIEPPGIPSWKVRPGFRALKTTFPELENLLWYIA
jgi:hypothetical protein